MFKNLKADMTHHLKEEDKEFINHKIEDLKQTAKQVGIVLAVAVPTAILLAAASHIGSEVLIHKLTNK
jgi:hypothetical protein